MGKGDKRTRRGKIFKGSFGKKRPTQAILRALKKERAAASPAAEAPAS